MAVFKRGGVWWYKFYFAGQFIRESSKSTSKTVARDAENQRRRELEQGYHNLRQKREIRIRLLRDIADEYLADYKLRFRGVTFAEYAIGHVVQHLGDKLLVDIGEAEVLGYQTARLKESASAKSINEEVRFLLTMMGEPGEVIRVRLRKKKKLKLPVRRKIGKAYEPEETEKMGQLSRHSRSPHIHLALTMALNAGMRDAEIKSLTWSQIHLDKGYLQVGRSKTAAGEGRTIPINSVLLQAIVEYRATYQKKFKEIREEWYVFPFGRPRPWDPTRHVTTLKTAWKNIRKNANVTGRWHDHRHTLITQLAESGAGEETIRQIVGHVSKEVLRDYLHVRMKAKREALEGIVPLPGGIEAARNGNVKAVHGDLPDAVTSVAVGAPTLFKVEHSADDPRLVFIKPITAGATASNLIISLQSGQEISLRLLSEGSSTGIPVDFVVNYEPRQSFLIGSTDNVAGNSASVPDPPAKPSGIDIALKQQSRIASPDWSTTNRGNPDDFDRADSSKPILGVLGAVQERGQHMLAAFSVVNRSDHWIEILPPQVELRSPSLNAKKKRDQVLAEQVPISEYRLTARRLAPGERADGAVEFSRPGFKQSADLLVLELGTASAVDHPLLLQLPFVAPEQ